MGRLTKLTGFFEEAPGVFSMTRLVMFMQSVGVLLLTLAASVVAVFYRDAAVVAALFAPLASLAGGIWGAARERNRGVEDEG